MGKFLRYCAGLFVRPHLAFRSLLGDRRRVVYGFVGVLVLAAVYFVAISVALTINVAEPPSYLVLNIPAARYYFYERFFILSVGLAGVILAAGVIRLAARDWNGLGRFEDLFALLGFSMIVVAVVIGLPDFAIALLTGVGIMARLSFEYVGLHVWVGTLWYLLLTIVAVKETERLAWGKSILLALLGFAANGAVQFIFIR